MKEFNCDLQIHGVYAAGVSNRMLLPVISEQSRLKGIDVLVTGDILHAKWFEHAKQNIVEESNGVYSDKGKKTFYIIGTEVEDSKRIHHLIYLPSLESALELREKLKGFGNLDCSLCGRPKLSLSAQAIAEKTIEAGGIIGPAHSFTPYTGMFAYFDSVNAAFGEMAEKVLFIELGLSADTNLADTISQNHKYSFLSSSDAHSPWPARIGREFNRIKMEKPSFKNLLRALSEKDEKLITLNAGLDPREGKYHATACSQCFEQYPLSRAQSIGFRCIKCRSQIKRGVRDRIEMLSDTKTGIHPPFRPPYMHILPLSEIIQLTLKSKSPNTQAVQSIWKDFIERFGNEITVLVDAKEDELLSVDTETAKKIIAFRKGWVTYIPGGGGNYGTPIIFDSEKEFMEKKDRESTKESPLKGQKTLSEF